MSRCFPFPPRGYEKKPQADQADLLIKKHKEKHEREKHEKEKREKEKRQGKERKDRDKRKDRSKGKDKEKKERKEKHKDGEKKKDKDRIKDEKKILYERKDSHTEGHNDRKSGEDGHQAADLRNAKFMEELGRRIRDERRAGDQMGANDTGKVQRKSQGMGISTKEERSTGKESVHSISIAEHKRMGVASAMEERGAGNEMDQNSASAEQRRLGRMGRPMDKYANKKTGKKEKAKRQKIDGRKGDKRKDENGEKKHKGKDKAINKEKEKEEKIKEKGEQKHEEYKLRDNPKREQIGSENVRPSFPPNDNAKSAAIDGCPKRKEANGFLHEDEVRPNKLLRASSSSQFSLENGVGDEALNMVKVEKNLDNKEPKINGVIDIHSPLNMRRPPLIADATKNGGTSKKPPHPDEKRLSQILHLPKMVEEWRGFDEQEWLLIRDDLRRKPRRRLESDEAPKVWAEAVRIESADILALPYVIPY